ncbi:hypothetical protein TGPRC2_310515 [Toxoplasma gondii TgCatPRC2]|uniref:Uncharacterized protein n=1 Tax=Toxoplasma gondii TgCatPRC2 TaxID=1130821 RepID=A0A151HL03_TOXGO|nr:hypothetical protein TGPRC2_310515 [Toxoplasma gondii TgCatPRC2]
MPTRAWCTDSAIPLFCPADRVDFLVSLRTVADRNVASATFSAAIRVRIRKLTPEEAEKVSEPTQETKFFDLFAIWPNCDQNRQAYMQQTVGQGTYGHTKDYRAFAIDSKQLDSQTDHRKDGKKQRQGEKDNSGRILCLQRDETTDFVAGHASTENKHTAQG